MHLETAMGQCDWLHSYVFYFLNTLQSSKGSSMFIMSFISLVKRVKREVGNAMINTKGKTA